MPSSATADAGLFALVELLAGALHTPLDPDEVRRAVDRASASAVGDDRAAPFSRLALSASAAGLNLIVGERPVADAVRAAAPDAPVVTLAQRDGSEEWIAVLGRRRGRVRVAWPRLGLVESLPLRDLAALVGAREQELVSWALVEPELPLAALQATQPAGAPSPGARLRALLRVERGDVAVVLIYAVGVGLLSLAVPVAVQSLVSTIAFGVLLQPLMVLTLAVLVGLTVLAILRALQVKVVELLQQRLFVRLVLDLARRLPRARAEELDGEHAPELVNRFFDVLTVQKSASSLLLEGVALVLQTAIGMLLLAFYHPFLLAFDAALVGAVTFVALALGRGATATSIKESKAKYEAAAWLEEIARHLAAFKGAGGMALALQRGDELARAYLAARRKHFAIVLRQVVGMLTLQALASSLLLGLGGWLVIQQQLTLGQLVAAELVVTGVVGGLAKLGKHLETYYDLLAALDKVGQLVDLKRERVGGLLLPRTGAAASVRLADVSVEFEGGRAPLRRVSLELPPGARVGVLAGDGEGKSTLLDVLYGLRGAASGVFEIDGIDARDLSLDDWRDQTALVRDVEIFSGTLEENVRLGRRSIGPEEVRAALVGAALLDEVQALPAGLSTRLTTGGWPLTPSQAHRLMLARAIAGRPRLLLLDEALDPLDARLRAAVSKALLARDAPWTVLVAARHPEALAGCHETWRLRGGALTRVVDAGGAPG